MSEAGQPYARPPITEAILEIRFKAPFSAREMDRMRDKFKGPYPAIEERHEVSVRVQNKTSSATAKKVGYKMNSSDGCGIVLIQGPSFATIRLAPYQGWDKLFSQVQENFEIVTKIVGRQPIVRLGARFVNRVDIPFVMVAGRDPLDVIRVGVRFPDELDATLSQYALNALVVEKKTGCKIRFQSGIVTPALVDHLSVSIDIDAFTEGELPTKIEEVWTSFSKLREAKNRVFECALTDEIRGLFQ